ncbi:diguanylate cyclase domain-containing protein, partial [Hydrogenophaga sp.]|uniref:sensor domain-containing diguanylate cyclase n=1 Tax=Hydrogenophaga sp. TaxID=1904254 RepID=UPI00286D953E
LRDFAELSADWFWEQDAEFRFTRFFGLATEKLQRKESDFFGKRRWDMPIHGITEAQLAEHIASYERHEPFRNFEYEVPGVGGALQYYSVSGTPVFDAQGNFVGYHGVGRNITGLRRAELAIKASERQLSQIVDGSPIATFVLDAEHRVTHWNQACEKLTGLSAREMLGTADVWRALYAAPRPVLADLVLSAASNETIAGHYPQFSRSALIDGAFEAEDFFEAMGAQGCWVHFTAAPLKDADGRLIGAMETLQDISEQRKAHAALEALATRDGLTGIANRRCFDEKLRHEWKRQLREASTLSLLMIDVDHFKRYNDSYGHQAGDRCLQQIAGVLEQVVFRPGDLVARYGGEEFVVILGATPTAGAGVVARRILDRVAALALPHSGSEHGHVTLSIGIATSVPQPDTELESLIAAADAAL